MGNTKLESIIFELVIYIIVTVMGCTAKPVCPEHAVLILFMMPIPVIGIILCVYDLVRYIKFKRKP